jgi:hypothetical protein
MKKVLAAWLITLAITTIALALDKEEREKNLAQSIQELSIPNGIVDMYKNTNGQITVYIGGNGFGSANLIKLSSEAAERQAYNIADASANKAFAEFIQKNVDAILTSDVHITDASLDVDEIMKKMDKVTENEKLAKDLRPEDRAAIMKAIIDTVIDSIRNSTGFKNVTTESVKQAARQQSRGMYLFGSHAGERKNEIHAVKVFRWSPNSATFAAQAEGLNNQKAIEPERGAEKLVRGWKNAEVQNKPFISHADDF